MFFRVGLIFLFQGFCFASEPLPLDLESAISTALQNNRTMLGATDALERVEISFNLVASEFDLKIVPRGETSYIGGGSAGSGVSVGGGVDFSKKFGMGTTITAGPSLVKAANKYSSNLRIKLTQPILRGWGPESTLAGLKAAEYGKRAAHRSFYRNMVVVVYRTVELMYEVAKQREMLVMEEETYTRLFRFAKSTQVKEKIGLAEALDVYRANLELKQAEEALSQSKERYQDSIDLLIDHLGLPSGTRVAIDVPIGNISEQWNLDEAIDTALENRIELEEVWDQFMESKRLSNLARRNSQLPDLNFVMDYSNLAYDEEFTGMWGKKRESRWGMGFTTSTGATSNADQASFEQSLLNVQNAERVCIDTKNGIVLEVKRTLRAYERAAEKIATMKQIVKNVEGEMKLARIKFLRGYANNFDVIQAEKNFRSAQTNLINAYIDHELGAYKLRASVGLIIERDCYL